MADQSDFWDLDDSSGRVLLSDLKDLIKIGYESVPRHQQQALGPSQVGHPCLRNLAYGLTFQPKINPGPDPLASIFGTAMHAWLDWAAIKANEQLGRTRWITEQKVTARIGLSGSCDLFDCDTLTNTDWKTKGKTTFDKFVRHGPTITEKRQVQIYGYGFRESFGVTPKRVSIAVVPRNGTLYDMKIWTAPFDPAVAENVFDRIDTVIDALYQMDADRNPAAYTAIPHAPSEECRYCPWWSPAAKGHFQCSGGVTVT